MCSNPGYLKWAGLAVFKKAYRIFQERGNRIRLLSAAFRNHMHWSELIGGDVVISPPYARQVRHNASDIALAPRIDKPVDLKIVDELSRKFVDFRRAYTEGDLTLDAFDSYGPTRLPLDNSSLAAASSERLAAILCFLNGEENLTQSRKDAKEGRNSRVGWGPIGSRDSVVWRLNDPRDSTK
jgi:hypothetical protein